MDLNNDGLIDLVAGDTQGNVWFYKNVGTKTAPKLAAGVLLEADGKPIKGTPPQYDFKNGQMTVKTSDAVMGIYSKLHVVDYDGDGLLDLLVGQESPKNGHSEIVFYKNVGTKTDPKFAAPVPLTIAGLEKMSRPAPFVADWDGDGKKDLLISTESGDVYFLRNTGTNEKPEYAKPEKIELPGLDKGSIRCRLTVVDWNNDGKLDLLVGTFHSTPAKNSKSPATMGGNVWLFLRK